jgi:hypothetical protein
MIIVGLLDSIEAAEQVKQVAKFHTIGQRARYLSRQSKKRTDKMDKIKSAPTK